MRLSWEESRPKNLPFCKLGEDRSIRFETIYFFSSSHPIRHPALRDDAYPLKGPFLWQLVNRGKKAYEKYKDCIFNISVGLT